MPRVFNPEGYAFVSFASSYERIQSWDWGYYAKQYGHMPNKFEYVRDGLDLFNKMKLDTPVDTEEDARVLVATIEKYMCDGIREEVAGKWGKLRDGTRYAKEAGVFDNEGHAFESESVETILKNRATTDTPESIVLDRAELERKLRLVRARLNEEELRVLAIHILNGGTMAEAAAEAGLDRKGYDRVRRRIPYACRDLEFG